MSNLLIKKTFVENLRTKLKIREKENYIFLLNKNNLSSNAITQIKEKFGGLIFAKGTLVQKTLAKLGFTIFPRDLAAFQLFTLKKNKLAFLKNLLVHEPIVPGKILTADILLKAGPTGFGPGRMLREFTSKGAVRKLIGGIVTLQEDFIVAKVGAKVDDALFLFLNKIFSESELMARIKPSFGYLLAFSKKIIEDIPRDLNFDQIIRKKMRGQYRLLYSSIFFKQGFQKKLIEVYQKMKIIIKQNEK
jgi:hypothetical protein